MMKTILIAGAAWAGIASPALAEPVTIHVSVEGLDLATAQGRAELAKRADNVARSRCGSASASDLRGRKVVRECRETVMASVMRHAASTRLAEAAE